MPLQPVRFHLDGETFERQHDRSQLRVGTILHVSRDADRQLVFTNSPVADGHRFCVTWIAPSDWAVSLQDRWPPPDILRQWADVITDVLGDALDAATVERACRVASQDVRLEDIYNAERLQASQLTQMVNVAGRLKLVRALENEAVLVPLWAEWRPLVEYLLLTCFDRLGQPADWLEFGSWLNAERTRDERDAVQVGTEGAVEAARRLYTRYNEIYGARSAFFRFIDEVLPTTASRRLFDGIEITRLQNGPDLVSEVLDDRATSRWLFKLRNDYTHRAQPRPGVSSFLMPAAPPEFENNFLSLHSQEVGATHWTSVMVRNWPQLLQDTVKAGLAESLRRLALVEQRRE